MPVESSRIPRVPSSAPAAATGLRADARNNRNRILDAARETFAALGLDVPMSEIARRSGVGAATLYRRFPTKEALVTEVFADQLSACVSVVDEALADPDPWHGFCSVIEKVCAMHAVDRGFTAAFLSAFPDAVAFEEERVRAERGFAVLTRRAKDAGRLRSDFAQADLTLVLMANGGIATGSTEAALAASRRLVAYLLQAFRADHADPAEPLPPAPPLGLHHVHRPPTA
ncbi:TetR/AcrR family transcriptional regulator [Streptomyces scopuliridis]|uniref:TetR/AcrR family transcriptional regulator n=1 Tax=Streptomyces scopuliridis TaxID=452529 RepID=A0ACD4ZU26_9ACTN|nr:helix-turn-helix domain-containing protein [Streptomyces scopuliridis]WSB37346.1 TetR/AcrR family transcriptional regulator [Streptomyces scopuliridis]WSC01961.1 TetR/AcrR family transcriptional regulator [Streptomyces scopuliridis]WSC04502.1 TetR/AcrR family transcriptional regulator [Streptomyces scopuliridis]